MLEERADVPIVRPLTITNHAGQSAARPRRRAAGGTGCAAGDSRGRSRDAPGWPCTKATPAAAAPPALPSGPEGAPEHPRSRLGPSPRRGPGTASRSPPRWGSPWGPSVFSMECSIGPGHLPRHSPAGGMPSKSIQPRSAAARCEPRSVTEGCNLQKQPRPLPW